MSESENIVVETAEKIFADLADAQTINHDKEGKWKAPLWKALTEAGLPLSWVGEDCGGSGASLAEGFGVVGAAGRHAIAVPLAETMLAGWLLAQAKIASPEGEMTVLPASPRDRITLDADGALSGRCRGVPFAKAAKHFAVLAHGKDGVSIALVDAVIDGDVAALVGDLPTRHDRARDLVRQRRSRRNRGEHRHDGSAQRGPEIVRKAIGREQHLLRHDRRARRRDAPARSFARQRQRGRLAMHGRTGLDRGPRQPARVA